jgi:beta-galactosidase
MTGNSMQLDEMDEPHPYEASKGSYNYPLGDLNYKSRAIVNIEESGAVQLVNEYGWIWLWRNGMPSKLTVDIYKFYIGPNSTPAQNRELQAYWLQLETEWLRSNASIAGVLAFCHLTNNYGYTGDWFIDNIKDLEPGLTLRWFKHAFAPSAVFINLPDERYFTKTSPHKAGSELIFNLCGVNDLSKNVTGTVTVKLIDETGKTISGQTMDAVLKPYQRTALPVKVNLPETAGGYLLLCEFKQAGDSGPAVLSRRYLRVGESDKYAFFNIKL